MATPDLSNGSRPDDYTLTISDNGTMPDYTYGIALWYRLCGSVKHVNIENGVTTIGYMTFYGCSRLIEITNHATTPQTIINILITTCLTALMKALVYSVPEGLLAAYRTAEVWKDFGNIEGMTVGY